MPRVDVQMAPSANFAIAGGGGVNYQIMTLAGVRYQVYIDRSLDVVFNKSTNGGFTWSNPTVVFAGTTGALSVWYDRWSGVAADMIHCAYRNEATHDFLYRSIDTASSDSLGTETTVFAGASVAAGGALTIWSERNGHLRVAGSIDAGAEDGAWSSTDAGATWGDTIADPSEGATQDQYLGLPGWNADTADGMIIFWDVSADEISVKRYDDSGNTWGETSIATTMVDVVAATTAFANFAAAIDLTNSQNILVAWSRVDFATASLRCWTINDTTITEKTAVVASSTDDQGLCAIGIDIDTGYWYVFYQGKTDGSETWATATIVYYKVSTDAGTTWGAETQLSSTVRNSVWLACTPRFTGDFGVSIYNAPIADGNLFTSALLPMARAHYQIGM